MTVDQFRSGSQGAANAERPTTTLIERLTQGEPYAISFGGQGGAWLPTLTELVVDALDMARWQRKPVGTTVHSDRGAQYTSWYITRPRECVDSLTCMNAAT